MREAVCEGVLCSHHPVRAGWSNLFIVYRGFESLVR
jgi:hypothetical protein